MFGLQLLRYTTAMTATFSRNYCRFCPSRYLHLSFSFFFRWMLSLCECCMCVCIRISLLHFVCSNSVKLISEHPTPCVYEAEAYYIGIQNTRWLECVCRFKQWEQSIDTTEKWIDCVISPVLIDFFFIYFAYVWRLCCLLPWKHSTSACVKYTWKKNENNTKAPILNGNNDTELELHGVWNIFQTSSFTSNASYSYTVNKWLSISPKLPFVYYERMSRR